MRNFSKARAIAGLLLVVLLVAGAALVAAAVAATWQPHAALWGVRGSLFDGGRRAAPGGDGRSRYAIGGAAFMERTEGQIERRRSGRLQDQISTCRGGRRAEEIDEAVAHLPGRCEIFSSHGRSVGCRRRWRWSWRRSGRPERPRYRRTLWDVRLGHRGESTAIGDAA